MLKLLDKIILFINLFAIAGLLGAYSASYVNPNVFILPSLLGLAYPLLLISNLLILFYWIARWKKMAWIELLVILIGIPIFMSYFGTAQPKKKQQQGKLSILSYNVRYFDHYNWSNQKNTKTHLLNYLKNFSGQIICLQESHLKNNTDQKQSISKTLKTYRYQYIHNGMSILSQYPMLHKGAFSFKKSSSGNCIYCDLLISQDTFRLYNIHLESFKLGKEERKFMKEISQGLKNNELPKGIKRLTSRLMIGNKSRALQAEEIKNHILQSPYPVIVCGDFNDTPLSYTYQKIKQGLKDSFIEKGRGLGQTYIGEFPSFRIDYILHSPQIETMDYQKDGVCFSDHYPIKAQLSYQTK